LHNFPDIFAKILDTTVNGSLNNNTIFSLENIKSKRWQEFQRWPDKMVADKMVQTKWYWTKWYGQNGMDKMV